MTDELSDEDVAGIVRYWEQPTGYYAAPPGMVEAAQRNVRMLADLITALRSQVATLSAERDEALRGQDTANRALDLAKSDRDAAEAERDALSVELDEAKNRAAEVAPLREYLAREQERKFAAEALATRQGDVVEAAREVLNDCNLSPDRANGRKWCITHQEWTPCPMAELSAALARLDADTPGRPEGAES